MGDNHLDPTFGMRRMALAVIRQAVVDFTKARDFQIWRDAERFLFPDDAENREDLRRTVEASGTDRYRLDNQLARARELTPVRVPTQTTEPPGFRSCKNCGLLPVSLFGAANRDGKLRRQCKRCLADLAEGRRRFAGIHSCPPRSCEITEPWIQKWTDILAAAIGLESPKRS